MLAEGATVTIGPVPTKEPVPFGPVYQLTDDPEPATPPEALNRVLVFGQMVPGLVMVVIGVDSELTVIVPVVVAGGQPPVVVTV